MEVQVTLYVLVGLTSLCCNGEQKTLIDVDLGVNKNTHIHHFGEFD